MSSPSIPKPPEILDRIVDVVLGYKPKPKTKAAKKRKKASSRDKPKKRAKQ